KCGIYVRSYIHPEAFDKAQGIITAALRRYPRSERLPVYFCVRRYQDWLAGSLSTLGFEPWASQAVMVKHTACRVEQPVFKPAHIQVLEGVAHARTPVVKITDWSHETKPSVRMARKSYSHR